MAFVRRHWIWIAAIVIVLAIAGSLSQPGDEPATAGASVTGSPSATPAPTTAEPTATEAPPASPTVVTGLGPRADFIATFEAEGFVGEESPLSDGQPRWLAQRAADSAVAEAIGPAEALTQVSVTVPASSESGVLVGEFLNTYAPGSRPFFQAVLAGADPATGADESRGVDGRTVHVIVIPASDGALVTVSVTP